MMRQIDFALRGYQIETDKGFEWVIEYPDLPGIVGGGASYAEALGEAEANKQFYLEHLRESHQPEPVPKDVADRSELSGKLTLRTSKTLHQSIVRRSLEERVSINSLINEALSAYLTAQDAVDLIVRVLADARADTASGRVAIDVDALTIQERPAVYGAKKPKKAQRHE